MNFPAWSQVESDPEFQSLDVGDKRRYFDEWNKLVTDHAMSRGLYRDSEFSSAFMGWRNQKAAEYGDTRQYDTLESLYESYQQPEESFLVSEIKKVPAALRESFGRPLESQGETAEVFGLEGVANVLKGVIREPENYESAAERFISPEPDDPSFLGFAWQYAPRAALEQTGQLGGSMLSRTAGSILGGKLGGPAGAAIGGFLGPALFEASQIIGPVAKERARRNGREKPNDEDIFGGIITSIGSGALNAIGAKYLPGGEKSTGPFFRRLASSFMGETFTETPQALIEQVGSSAFTDEGLDVDLKAAIGEGLIGGVSAGGATVIQAPLYREKVEEVAGKAEDAGAPETADALLEVTEKAKSASGEAVDPFATPKEEATSFAPPPTTEFREEDFMRELSGRTPEELDEAQKSYEELLDSEIEEERDIAKKGIAAIRRIREGEAAKPERTKSVTPQPAQPSQPAPAQQAEPATQTIDVANQPDPNAPALATEPAPPRPTKQTAGKDWRAKAEQWDNQYEGTHNRDGSIKQLTFLETTLQKITASGFWGKSGDERYAGIGTSSESGASSAVRLLLNNGWFWDANQQRMVNPANPNETPGQGFDRLSRAISGEPAITTPTKTQPAATAAQPITTDAVQKQIPAEGAIRQEPQAREGVREEDQIIQEPAREGAQEEVVAGLRAVSENTATPEQIASLSQAGLVDVIKGQPVVNEDGEAVLAQAQAPLPRLTPEERVAEIEGEAPAPELIQDGVIRTPLKGVTGSQQELEDKALFKNQILSLPDGTIIVTDPDVTGEAQQVRVSKVGDEVWLEDVKGERTIWKPGQNEGRILDVRGGIIKQPAAPAPTIREEPQVSPMIGAEPTQPAPSEEVTPPNINDPKYKKPDGSIDLDRYDADEAAWYSRQGGEYTITEESRKLNEERNAIRKEIENLEKNYARTDRKMGAMTPPGVRGQVLRDISNKITEAEARLSNVDERIAAQPSRAITPAPEPAAEAAPVAPSGIAAGNRVRAGRSPQTYVVEEVLESTPQEAELGEQYFTIRNERTGELQTVEQKDIKPVRERREAAVEEEVQPVPAEEQYTPKQVQGALKKLFGRKIPDRIKIINDPENKNKAGYYVDNGEIELNLAYLEKTDNLEDIITHEIGHFIYSDPEFQEAFQSFWESIPDDKKENITNYVKSAYSDRTGEVQIEEAQVIAFEKIIARSKRSVNWWTQLKDIINRAINRIFGTDFEVSDQGAMAVLAAGIKRYGSGERIIRETKNLPEGSDIRMTGVQSQDTRFAELEARARAGDKEAEAEAQRMVDEAAKAAGYDTGPVWHGSPDFIGDEFDLNMRGRRGLSRGGFSFTRNKQSAEEYMQSGVDPSQKMVDEANALMRELQSRINSGLEWSGPYNEDAAPEFRSDAVDSIDDLQGYIGEIASTLPDDLRAAANEIATRQSPENFSPNPRLIRAFLKDPKVVDVSGRELLLAESPNQIKSAAPFTYDDEGNLIPLSQRFQPTERDIRRMAVEPRETVTEEGAPDKNLRFAELEAKAAKGDKEARSEAQRMVDEAAKAAKKTAIVQAFPSAGEPSIPKVGSEVSLDNEEGRSYQRRYAGKGATLIKAYVDDGSWDYSGVGGQALTITEDAVSAAPFTYDSEGNLIPLSERFRATKPKKTNTQKLVEMFTEVTKQPVKITVNERTALKDQIRLKAREAREGIKARKQASQEILDTIKGLVIRGKVRPAQLRSLTKRAIKLIPTNEKSVEGFLNYFDRVVENANYDKDVENSKNAQKEAARFLKQKKKVPANKLEILKKIGKINPAYLDNPGLFAAVVNEYLLALKSPTSKDYRVVPDDVINGYLNEAGEASNKESEKRKKALLESKLKRALDNEDATEEELRAFQESGQYDAHVAKLEDNKKQAVLAALKKSAEETKESLGKYDYSEMNPQQQSIIDRLRRANIEALSPNELRSYILFGDNIIANDVTYGAESAAIVIEAKERLNDFLKNNENARRGRLAFKTLENLQEGTSAEVLGQSDAFRNIFGKGKILGTIQRALGIKELNEAQVEVNETIKDIEQEFDIFYKDLSKKYPKANDEDNLLAEGVVSYIIQKQPELTEEQSIAERIGTVEALIANWKRTEDQAEFGKKVETALNTVRGTTVQQILDNLKAKSEGNYKSLMWIKNTLLPTYREAIKSFDENFQNQIGDYSDPNYIPITWKRRVVSPESIEDSIDDFRREGISIPQPASTIARKRVVGIPKDQNGRDMDLDFNVRKDTFNSLVETVAKSYTAPAWLRIKSFLSDPRAVEVFGTEENLNNMTRMLGGLYFARNRRAYSMTGINKLADTLTTGLRRLGSGYALGGVSQAITQPADQVLNTIINVGDPTIVGLSLMPGQQLAAIPFLQRFPIGQRADVLAGTNFLNASDAAYQRVERYLKSGNYKAAKAELIKFNDTWLIVLKQSDMFSARSAWMSYYMQGLKQAGITFKDWDTENRLYDSDPQRQEIALRAEALTDINQGSSDPTKMALFAQRGRSGSENVLKAMLLPFNSFAVQQKARMASDFRDIITGTTSLKEKVDAARGLTATIAGLVAFNYAATYIRAAMYAGGASLLLYAMGVEEEEMDEEEKKELAKFKFRKFMGRTVGNIIAGGGGQLAEGLVVDAFNYAAYMIYSANDMEEVKKKDGELMKFSTFKRTNAPLWRYESIGGGMDLGIFTIPTEQISKTASAYKELATPEFMDKFTDEERRVIYFNALIQTAYLTRMSDTDVYRAAGRAKQMVEETAEEREKKRRAAIRRLAR